MIKISIAKRYALVALVLAIAAGLFWYDFGRRYLRASAVKNPDVTRGSVDSSSSGGWELLFERRSPAREEVAVIAERNVFSPLRKAWTPPPPPEPEKVPEEPKAPPPPPKRDGVELRGTAMVGNTRTAMIHFRPFNPPETLLLREGGVAKPSKADGPVFTMVRIEPDRVIMKDSAGAEFQVGLYDHSRQTAAQTPVQQQAVVSTETPKAAAPPASSVVSKAPRKETPDAIQERNEQLVKEGKMRKILTPFGPVYRKQ